MAETQSISAGTVSIPLKKEIRNALEAIRSHSQCLSSFTLQWQDLQDHLDFVQKSIEDCFKALESREQQSRSSDQNRQLELINICRNMDGEGLRSFILEHRKSLQKNLLQWKQIGAALRSAPNLAKLVLDSIQRFYPTKMKNHLVDQLFSISPTVTKDLEARAEKMAHGWMRTIGKNGENAAECFSFLQFLAVYGLGSRFDADELLDRFVLHVSRRIQTVDLCRALGLTERIPDFVKKLASSGRKQIDAVNFAYAFDLVNKFPPVPLLKIYWKESEEHAKEILKEGKGSRNLQYEATSSLLSSARLLIKCIEEHNLKHEYPSEDIEKCISELLKCRACMKDGKRSEIEKQKKKTRKKKAKTAGLKQKQPNKRPRQAVAYRPVPTVAATKSSFTQFSPQQLLSSAPLDNHAPLLSVGLHSLPTPSSGTADLYCRLRGSFLGFETPLGHGSYDQQPVTGFLGLETPLGHGGYDQPGPSFPGLETPLGHCGYDRPGPLETPLGRCGYDRPGPSFPGLETPLGRCGYDRSGPGLPGLETPLGHSGSRSRLSSYLYSMELSPTSYDAQATHDRYQASGILQQPHYPFYS